MYYPLNFNVEWARKISGLFVLAYPDGWYLTSKNFKNIMFRYQKCSKYEHNIIKQFRLSSFFNKKILKIKYFCYRYTVAWMSLQKSSGLKMDKMSGNIKTLIYDLDFAQVGGFHMQDAHLNLKDQMCNPALRGHLRAKS
jgi:hypothetical protein